MPRTDPFEAHTERYEAWFETHGPAYDSELAALETHIPADADAFEIGVGTGRFAAPLDIGTGIDPAREMLTYAADRSVAPIQGLAEHLPLDTNAFDAALIVTTICFVDDIDATLQEARRVLRPGGRLILGYIDADSPVGQFYREHKDENPFYRDATFVATDELIARLEAAGFDEFAFTQTLFDDPTDLTEPDRVDDGHGEGSFVALSARA